MCWKERAVWVSLLGIGQISKLLTYTNPGLLQAALSIQPSRFTLRTAYTRNTFFELCNERSACTRDKATRLVSLLLFSNKLDHRLAPAQDCACLEVLACSRLPAALQRVLGITTLPIRCVICFTLHSYLLLDAQTEKALLLASLLLGYGLDAWVVFGTDAVGQHTWVLTRSSREAVVFWDACTGKHGIQTCGSCPDQHLQPANVVLCKMWIKTVLPLELLRN